MTIVEILGNPLDTLYTTPSDLGGTFTVLVDGFTPAGKACVHVHTPENMDWHGYMFQVDPEELTKVDGTKKDH